MKAIRWLPNNARVALWSFLGELGEVRIAERRAVLTDIEQQADSVELREIDRHFSIPEGDDDRRSCRYFDLWVSALARGTQIQAHLHSGRIRQRLAIVIRGFSRLACS